jgi:hypothetical protein
MPALLIYGGAGTFLAKIEDRFPLRRFWFTDEESYRANILGKIWWTARDFREATYSLLN